MTRRMSCWSESLGLMLNQDESSRDSKIYHEISRYHSGVASDRAPSVEFIFERRTRRIGRVSVSCGWINSLGKPEA